MKVIYKYPLNNNTTVLDVPYRNSRLSIDEDGQGQLCVWYMLMVDGETDDMIQRFEYRVFGTGIEITDPVFPFDDNNRPFTHSDTVVMKSGLVWHVFVRQLYE